MVKLSAKLDSIRRYLRAELEKDLISMYGGIDETGLFRFPELSLYNIAKGIADGNILTSDDIVGTGENIDLCHEVYYGEYSKLLHEVFTPLHNDKISAHVGMIYERVDTSMQTTEDGLHLIFKTMKLLHYDDADIVRSMVESIKDEKDDTQPHHINETYTTTCATTANYVRWV